MTYLGFLVLFLVPAIAALWFLTRRKSIPGAQMSFVRACALICGIAFLYTTPWDNYLVWSGVWTYGTDRVVGTLFWVPLEEYAFFLGQPVMTALWIRLLLVRGSAGPEAGPAARHALWITPALTGAAGLVLLAFGPEATTYLALILAWASPVILALALYAHRTLRRHLGVMASGIAVPTVYLWIADAIAIADGVWTIEEPTSTGMVILGLPVEEAVFFLLTNVLVVMGLLTFLFGPGRSEIS